MEWNVKGLELQLSLRPVRPIANMNTNTDVNRSSGCGPKAAPTPPLPTVPSRAANHNAGPSRSQRAPRLRAGGGGPTGRTAGAPRRGARRGPRAVATAPSAGRAGMAGVPGFVQAALLVRA